MTRRFAGGWPQMSAWGRPGMVGGVGGGWSVRVRHVLWLLLLWMVCGLHLLYLFASYGVQSQSHLLEERGVGDAGSAGPAWRTNGGGGGGQRPVRDQGLSSGQGRQDSSGPGGLMLEDQAVPGHRLEGQQLRHLAANRDSLLYPNYTGGPPYRHIKKLAAKKGGKTIKFRSNDASSPTSILHNKRQTPGGGGDNVASRGDSGRQKTRLHTSPLPPTGSENNTGNGNADPLVSTRPDAVWVACQSVVPPVGVDSGPRMVGSGSGSPSSHPGWQAVRPGQSYVFSAYHDPRPMILGGKARHGVLRVIGMTDTHVDGAPQFCQLWYVPPEEEDEGETGVDGGRSSRGGRKTRRRGQYGQRSTAPRFEHPQEDAGVRGRNETAPPRARLVVVPATSDIVPETHGLRFAPFIYTCRLGSGVLPAGVSMTHSRCDTPNNYLHIRAHSATTSNHHHPYHHHHHHHHRRRPANTNYTVCVTPFNFNYNNVDQLVEKIEVDRMFGANKFIFYNYSSGPDLARYLQSYVQDGIAEVVQWKLPVRVDTWPRSARPEVDVHYFGQLAVLNDCLYRVMFTSQMVVFSDMDELVVPHRHATWREMVAFLHHKGQGTAATYIFQNSFFRTEWPNDPRVAGSSGRSASAKRIMSLAKTKRERYVYPWGMRSKYICDPLKVEMVGVHNIWRFVNDSFTELDVPADVGLLHHYRSWENPQEKNSVSDRAMHAYYDVILSRVRARHVDVRERGRTLQGFSVRSGER